MLTKSYLKDSTLVVEIHGKIDSVNAEELKNEFAELDKDGCSGIQIDAKNLEYISSSGLRAILTLAKQKNVSVVNTNTIVYEIFEVTGFTEIINVKKALKKIDVSNMEIIGRGGHGDVYRIDDDSILKLNRANVPYEKIEDELTRAKEAFKLGVPTAISYNIVETDDGRFGVVYETIKSKALCDVLSEQADNFDNLMAEYVQILKDLHQTEGSLNIFGRTKDIYSKCFANTKAFTASELETLNKILDAIPEKNTLVHFDGHPKNVMIQDDMFMFVDMGDLSLGHPLLEWTGIFMILYCMWEYDTNVAPFVSGMNRELATCVYMSLVKNYYGLTEAELRANLPMFKLLGLLKVSALTSIFDVPPAILQAIKEQLLPYSDRLVDWIKQFSAKYDY